MHIKYASPNTLQQVLEPLLTLLHSDRPNLYIILASLSVIGLTALQLFKRQPHSYSLATLFIQTLNKVYLDYIYN